MTISFTGVGNLRVEKANPKKIYGMYLSHNNEIKEGEKILNRVKLKFDLTNDNAGSDLDDLKKAVEHSGRSYIYNQKHPEKVELYAKNYTIHDDVIPQNYTLFKLNNKPVPLLSRNDLELYTQLAKITRKLSEHPDTTDVQKRYTNWVNSKIAAEAENYLNKT